MKTDASQEQATVRAKVREGYAKIARGPVEPRGGCCGAGTADRTARAVGYSDAELETLPDGANMGLSCGNPTAIAGLAQGETVVDLGSGGGFDVFIAAAKVGPRGRAVGVDMTPDMLDRARRNARAFSARTGLDNVEFRLGEIEHLPLADSTADVVISNCVINLSPDKPQVWREIARVLRPGGRVSVSDLALRRPLPLAILKMMDALVGCVAGAVPIDDTLRMAREAGLSDVEVAEKPAYVDSVSDWDDPLYRKIAESLPEGTTAADYIVSVDVTARKPAA